MIVSDTFWQRRPILFASGLAALIVLGLAVMLGESGVWKYLGLLCALSPPILATLGYLKHRR